MDASEAADACSSVIDTVSDVVVSEREFLETVLTGVLAGGHVLLEDVPGTGKTLTAHSLATALGLEFNRVQFTPDLLPADITGSNVFNEETREFEFQPGPVFANVVLADEINRAPPKTQAALLEAMEEKQVSVAGETHPLPEPFFVVATQNPVEQEGTFPLPEAQKDRFWMKTSIGYPDRAGEVTLLDRRLSREQTTPTADRVLSADRVETLQQVPETVSVEHDLRGYIADLARETRTHRHIEAGVSPRGTQRLLELSRAYAVLEGRDYLTPEDVKRVAVPALSHRLVLTPDAQVSDVEKRSVIENVLDSVEVPTVD